MEAIEFPAPYALKVAKKWAVFNFQKVFGLIFGRQ